MTKEMVISANRHETKVAVLEDDQLVEVYFQRVNEYSLAGSIHKGRVTRVLPGMQSAFVDLGLERDTFLYVSDFFEENEEFDKIGPERGERDRDTRDTRERRPREERGRDDRGREERGREDRGREQRPRREERVEASPEAPMPTVEEGVDTTPETVVEGATPETEPAPSEAAAAERGPRQDRGEFDRDRHRRSRRRRNRGRGFPESKYASSTPHDAERHAAEPTEPVVEELASALVTGEDFAVLPGESLAKYRHTALPMLDSGEQEEFGAAGADAEHTAEQSMTEEFLEQEHLTVLIDTDIVEGTEPEMDEVSEEAESDLELVPPPATEAEVHELLAEALAESEETIEPIADVESEAEAEQDTIPETAAEDVFSALEPAEVHQDENTTESLMDAPVGENETGEGETGVAGEAAAEGDAAPGGPVEASVREQGGRYLQHRISRRMRRRMRGQGGRGEGGEGRRERESEPAPAAEGAKPELRHEPQRHEPQRHEPRSEYRSESRSAPKPDKAGTPSITDLLKEGQEIIVQIAKEPLGQKGARITSHIALPGRYVVYMPTLEHMGVSRKIASDEERARLKRILQSHKAEIQGGYIVRTAGEGKSEEDIAADMSFLANLWNDIRSKAEKKPAPILLHHDLDIVQRLLRDQLTDNFKAIWVDNEEVYESILRFVQRFQPVLVSRVKLYTRPAPIFDSFNITAELEKALRPKVWLKSGGYIVINQTEALVAIDVNTGKFVGKSNRLEDTIVKTNTEAVKEIVRQIRLRDLGGIIVVDFIDMDERKNRQKVMQALEDAMRADKAPYKILQFNDFGLVAITRKRVKQSLERALCTPCPYCEGAGYVKSAQTIIGEILQEAQKIAHAVEGENNVILRVNMEVAKILKSTQNHYLEELEAILRRPVLVKGDPQLHHEKFDLA